jgi:hypothetical protein
MSELNLKRTAVIVISQILGFIIGYLIIWVGFDLLQYVSSVQTSQSRTIAEYGIQYFLVTSVPIGLTIMIWMDALLDTRILPD